jgi:tRNA A-37 threonylcarbamoyl transferase component Bud32
LGVTAMRDLGDHEHLIVEFERAWSDGQTPSIETFLQITQDARLRSRLLQELVCLDLEFQWKAVSRGERARAMTLEDYIDMFSELGPLADLPTELIEEEYRARTRWGDRPHPERFVRRFESRKEQILQTLRRVDVELSKDSDTYSSPVTCVNARRRVAAPVDPRAPLIYGDYLLQEMVGAGRMGKVYRARQTMMNRQVAVKFLRKEFLQNPEAVEQFIREANIVAKFEHPGIVKIHGLGTTPGGGYFIAMDLIEGLDLATRSATSPVSVQEAVEWTVQACEALHYTHNSGIIHCDLKPGNLLLSKSSQVRVTDFGLARSVSDNSHTVARIEGTAAYMAPEQVSGWWGPLTVQTDVYGMGAVLYELLTGRAPFSGGTLTDILSSVVSGVGVVSPELLRPELPLAIVNICLRSLAKQPAERYENLSKFADALRDADDV